MDLLKRFWKVMKVQQKSYQNNVEFYKMMQRVREEASKEGSKIKQTDENEKLLKLKEEMYKVQKDSQKSLLEAKDNDKKAKDALNEKQRKFMEQLRKYNK